jgi:hypothetical protein
VDLSGTVFRESPDCNDDDLSLATFRSCWKTCIWQCEARALCGKMSKIEEDFFGSACYTSQEAPLDALFDQMTRVIYLMRKRGASSR